MEKKVIVLGGTGFIGSHVVKEFLSRGYEVLSISNRKEKLEDINSEGLSYLKLDVQNVKQNELEKIFSGFNYLVFAIGADDRTIPKAPAYDFFYKANVETSVKVLNAAKVAGIKKTVFMSSYFAYLDRKNPEWNLAAKHPYILSRVAQEKESLRLASTDFEIVFFELPYVIGAMPGKTPLFKPLVQYSRMKMPLFFTKGGTSVISVKHIAEATVNAMENDVISGIYSLGEENLTWRDFFNRLNPDKKFITIPTFLLYLPSFLIGVFHKLKGKESGLKMPDFLKIQTNLSYIPVEPTRKDLGYSSSGLDEAFHDLVNASL